MGGKECGGGGEFEFLNRLKLSFLIPESGIKFLAMESIETLTWKTNLKAILKIPNREN